MPKLFAVGRLKALTPMQMAASLRVATTDPKQFAGSETVEIIWTAIPFLIVVFLFVLTLRGMNRADPPPAPSPD